ncbi:MAG TPA: sensor histidine kinase [Niabella sp.]|nr:sensor histidine kinase [Niabella sp.]
MQIRNAHINKQVTNWLLSLVILITAHDAIGQDTASDSLLLLYKKASGDTAKARLLFEIGDHLSATDTAKAIRYIQQGMQLAKSNRYTQAIGHFYQGRLYMDYNYDAGKAAFKKANNLFEKFSSAESYLYQSRSWSNIAVIEQYQNNDKEYTNILLNKAIPLALKSGDKVRVAGYYTLVGLPFMNNRNLQKAIYYFSKSNDIIRNVNPENEHFLGNYVNIARSYCFLKDYNSAKKYLDSAYRYTQLFPYSGYSIDYYIVKSMYHIDLKETEKGINSLDNGLKLARKNKNPFEIRELLYQKARIYDEQKNYIEAKNTIQELLNGGYGLVDGDRKQLYHDLAYLHEQLGDTKEAYKWLAKYTEFADSLTAKNNKLEFARLEAKYNYEKKEKELLLVSSKEKMQRILMWTSFGGLFTASLLFMYFYRLRKAKSEQQVQSLKQQQQIALTQALLQGEEKERARLARDLHDGLGGMLAGVKINLTHALQEISTPQVDKAISQLDHSITELRRIARNMMPEALLRSGLETALADLCQSLSNEKLKICHSFINTHAEAFSKQVQIIIFRIIQELLTNIVKHAEASEAYLQCSQDGAYFYITVEDNGKGINQSGYGSRRGIGLDNIQSRVDFLKGKMDFNSEPGKGTITNIEIRTDGTL